MRSSQFILAHFFVSLSGFVVAQVPVDLKLELIEKWNSVSSLKADFVLESNTEVGGSKGHSETTGTFEWLKIENDLAYRIYASETSTVDAPNFSKSSSFEHVTSYDGQESSSWIKHSGDSDYSSLGTPEVDPLEKRDRHPYLLMGGEFLFEELSDEAQVFFKGTDSVNGTSAYVFESILDHPVTIGGGAPWEKFVVHVSKDTGIPLQLRALDTNGGTIYSLTYSDLEINVDVDPSSFSNLDGLENMPSED